MVKLVSVTARYAFVDNGRQVAQGEIFSVTPTRALQLAQAKKVSLQAHHYRTRAMAEDAPSSRTYRRRDLVAEGE